MRECLSASRSLRKQGFTLVELLVVISIIGILVSLLVPVVQSARESGRRVQCANNLHQMGIGVHSYLEAWQKSPDPGALLHNFVPYMEAGPVYTCPTLGNVSSSSAGSNVSYGVNMCLQSMLIHDSNKIIVADATIEVLQYEGLTQDQWNADVAPRHNTLMNCLYFDGHVDPQLAATVNPYALVLSPSAAAAQGGLDVVSTTWRPFSGDCQTCGSGGLSGGGLLGTYYPGSSNEWASPSYTRIDSSMTYPFGGNHAPFNEPPNPFDPSGTGYPPWTATWTGKIMANTTDAYTFWVRVDNEAWVYINGQQIINVNVGGNACQNFYASQPVNMTAGEWVDIEIQYHQFQFGSPGHITVQWSSPSIPQQDIPSCNMMPAPSN
jgi:prepilin-type N-terminal cleavage/methylation domain-containing protein/prepilin-type processing-associated H-X9-DG protein